MRRSKDSRRHLLPKVQRIAQREVKDLGRSSFDARSSDYVQPVQHGTLNLAGSRITRRTLMSPRQAAVRAETHNVVLEI